MAEQAIPGEMVLNSAAITKSVVPTVEALVAAHSLMVFRIAYSILRNHHDAEDAAQECFVRVLKHQRHLHKVRNLKTWLARVAWTTALDKRQSGGTMVSLDESRPGNDVPELLDAAPLPDDRVESGQMQHLLQRLIAGLPEELRFPLELSTVQELNSVEIAEIMKIPEGTVRTRLLRARQQLKEKLAGMMMEGRRHG
jgi:RNA polymerase sigma-70 factor (ECF subfamily)